MLPVIHDRCFCNYRSTENYQIKPHTLSDLRRRLAKLECQGKDLDPWKQTQSKIFNTGEL